MDEGWALGLGWLLFALMLAALAIEVGSLRVTSLLYGHRPLGAELGYPIEREQGPRLIASAFRAWHRTYRVVPMSDVRNVDWDTATVTLSSGARRTPPHEDHR